MSVVVGAAWWASGCDAPDDDATSAYLSRAWSAYQERYLHDAGYVLDPRRDGGRVTSEGQGYALLRAVWERDEPTFRRIAAWTRSTLQRADGLHSWLWSPEGGGHVVDANTATDGDLEIAWALLLAADVFDDAAFFEHGARIVRAVREHARIDLPFDGSEGDDRWFPAAGDWAVEERIANLSYFVPYAHPWFVAADPEGDWEGVTEAGYDLLERAMAAPDRRLPPAFLRVDTLGAPGSLPGDSGLETEFSFDAVRLFWRVEADCRLHQRARACADPLGVPEALEALLRDSTVVSAYTPDGTPLTDNESLTFYGALLPAARRHAPSLAREVLVPRLDGPALDLLLSTSDRYFDHNWVWFGLALDRGVIEARTPAPPRARGSPAR